MSAAELIARLDRVKQTGAGRWIARCPAHDDRGPSLSVRELEDGRTLVHCFADCEVEAIVSTVGMQMSDLFPPRVNHELRQPRRRFDPSDTLCCLAHEAAVVLIAARELLAGHAIIVEDVERLSLAYRRIGAAVELIRA